MFLRALIKNSDAVCSWPSYNVIVNIVFKSSFTKCFVRAVTNNSDAVCSWPSYNVIVNIVFKSSFSNNTCFNKKNQMRYVVGLRTT